MSYQRSEHEFKSSKDGFRIYYQKWVPSSYKKVMVFQHGFGEHSGRYGHLIDALNGEGFAFYGLDSRGHGHTEGKRGHVDQFQQLVDDLADLIRIAKEETKQEKIVLLGHSLGGIIVLQYTLQGTNQENLQCLVVSSGGLKIQMDAEKKIKLGIAKMLARIAPAKTLPANLDLKYLSHDLSEVEAYQKDPLVHGMISFQMAVNTVSLGEVIYDKASHISIPIYILHGTGDGIVSCEGSRILYEKIPASVDKTLRMYEGLYHETFNELPADRSRVLGELRDWLKKH